jgi:hypothetical protein
MSDIGGSGKDGSGDQQTQYPFFQSPGGVTPQQTALGEYDYGQNLTQGQAQFEGSDEGGGNSLSTMATQVAGGANMGNALNLASMSDVNQNAALTAYGNAENIDQQNNQTGLASSEQALQQGTALGALAGKAAGGAAAA